MQYLSNTKIVVCNCFQFTRVQNFVIWKELNSVKFYITMKMISVIQQPTAHLPMHVLAF